jgi:hypothetical protein
MVPPICSTFQNGLFLIDYSLGIIFNADENVKFRTLPIWNIQATRYNYSISIICINSETFLIDVLAAAVI